MAVDEEVLARKLLEHLASIDESLKEFIKILREAAQKNEE